MTNRRGAVAVATAQSTILDLESWRQSNPSDVRTIREQSKLTKEEWKEFFFSMGRRDKWELILHINSANNLLIARNKIKMFRYCISEHLNFML